MFVLFFSLRKTTQKIVVRDYFKLRPDFVMIAASIGNLIPSGIENGMFQFGKLAIQSTVSTMGTIAIAAQAMTNILESVTGMWGIGVGICLMTIGQCIGAGKTEESKYYIVKPDRNWICRCFCFMPASVLAYKTGNPAGGKWKPESAAMCFQMITAITFVKPVVWCLHLFRHME